MNTKTLEQSFLTHFNAKPAFIVRAPGRVNLIGEHTDYNDGFVLPMAIDRAVWIALSPRTDSQVHIHSLDMETALPNDPQAVSTFDLNSLTKGKGWAEYIKGVADQLQKAGYQLRGFDAIITGDVPRGAGLSSSAAVELAAARAFAVTTGFEWNAAQMAALAQKAENEWVGVNCGIMDQMASAASQAGHALFLDCRTLEYQLPPLPKGIAVVILDTSTRRGLVDSAYNERRNQCEEAARWFGVKALRDVSVAEFNERTRDTNELNINVFKRARHIVTENERVLEAVKAMKLGNIQRLGELFNASHSSLRDDFEVTNEALNQIVACAQEHPHCFGARMTGAGFGGCAVALVREENATAFTQAVSAAYKQRSGLEASIYVCKASDGAGIIQG